MSSRKSSSRTESAVISNNGDNHTPKVELNPQGIEFVATEFPSETKDDADFQAAASSNILDVAKDFGIAQDFEGSEVFQDYGPGDIRVGKPNREWFFRIHPTMYLAPVFCMQIKEIEDINGIYLIHNSIANKVRNQFTSKRELFVGVTSDGQPFVWPIRIEGTNGRPLDDWSKMGHRAAVTARTEWIRLTPVNGNYKIERPKEDLDKPCFPPLSFNEIVVYGFDDKIIRDPDAPVLRRIKGFRR